MPIRSLCLAVVTFFLAISSPVQALKTGDLLRMHVVAHDDSPAMQSVKLVVRDAVRESYADNRPDSPGSMLTAAQAMLPQLTEAAQTAARDAGFLLPVSVSIEVVDFDDRTLDGITIPAGSYPALMIRMGDARGHNWWGLLDPDLALNAAAIGRGEGPVAWDWSLTGLWKALRRWFGGDIHA